MTPSVTSPEYWADRQSLLLGTLTTELYGQPPGTWVARQLRNGFCVSLARGEDGRRRVRISTPDRPTGEAAWTRYHEAIHGMTQHLGVSHWPSVAWSGQPGERSPAACMEFLERLVTQ